MADASFCVMGPAVTVDGRTTASESSAMLANALLTGTCVRPGQRLYMFLCPLLVSFAALACVFLLKPITLFITGICAALASGAAFSVFFVFSSYWLDPLIPMIACLSGTLLLFISRSFIGYDRVSRFRHAYAPYVGKDTLKALIEAGRPQPSETLNSFAAIIAIKKPGLINIENKSEPLESKKAVAKFRDEVLRTFRRAGAVILGFEGDIALVCFGSPLEQAKYSIEAGSLRAVSLVEDLLKASGYKSIGSQLSDCWFGIEAGECVFSWSEAAGYKANGRAVVRARLFTALAKKHNVRAIFGEAARIEAGMEGKKLGSLDPTGSSESGNYYELSVS